MYEEIIAISIIVLIIGLALFYIIKAKKRGRKCIGCPNSKTCGKKQSPNCGGCCGCSHNENN